MAEGGPVQPVLTDIGVDIEVVEQHKTGEPAYGDWA